MKILNPSQLAQLDNYTIENLPITSIDLMEKASSLCFKEIIGNFDRSNSFVVFAGVGNNGGDALAISRMLLEENYQVEVYLVKYSQNLSADNKTNLERLESNIDVKIISEDSNLDFNLDGKIVIDGIFGNGLNRAPESISLQVIKRITSQSKKYLISIDIPSGLFADKTTVSKEAIIKADMVYTFHSPKLAFFLAENKSFVKDWKLLDIGLDKKHSDSFESHLYYTQLDEIRKIYKPRDRFTHKGSYGHSLLIGGSLGKIGAIQLATKAAVKSGSGLVTALIPKCGYEILQTSVPEAMVLTEGDGHIDKMYYDINSNAIAIGPGLGTVVGTHRVLKDFLEDNTTTLVLDADALNLLSSKKELLNNLPEASVLTPHPVEFKRLVGSWKNDFEKLKLASEFAVNYQVILVLKDSYTAVVNTDGRIYFNSTGNAALATGGSGDVLTGIIVSLIAQKYSSLQASILGVYLHGLAADLAIKEGIESMESFSAGDIIRYLGRAFNHLYQT